MNKRLLSMVNAAFLVTLLWTLLFCSLLITRPIPLYQISTMANIVQLIICMITGIIALVYSGLKCNSDAVFGVALAVFSWTLGQLFWFSYTTITKLTLPYPSIGDLGFIGTYFILSGVIGIIKSKRDEVYLKQKKRVLWPLLFLLVPIILVFVKDNSLPVNSYNFILTLSLVYTMMKAVPIYTMKEYRFFVAGIYILGLTDIIFLSSVVLIPNCFTFTTDPLYPIALTLITNGLMKGEMTYHD